MIYCLINGKKTTVQHTHANNSGEVTIFMYQEKGELPAILFNLKDHNSVEDFLINKYSAEIINNN